jgi:anaerobic selenocysteine-containing dehydrogenase
LEDREFITERTEDYEKMKEVVLKYTPEVVEGITGVPVMILEKQLDFTPLHQVLP